MRRKTDFLANFHSRVAPFLSEREARLLRRSLRPRGELALQSRAKTLLRIGESDNAGGSRKSPKFAQNCGAFREVLASLSFSASRAEAEDSFEEFLISERTAKLRRAQRERPPMGAGPALGRSLCKENKARLRAPKAKRANFAVRIRSPRSAAEAEAGVERLSFAVKRNPNTAARMALKRNWRKGPSPAEIVELAKRRIKPVSGVSGAAAKVERALASVSLFVAANFVFSDARKDAIALRAHFERLWTRAGLGALDLRREFPLLAREKPRLLAELAKGIRGQAKQPRAALALPAAQRSVCRRTLRKSLSERFFPAEKRRPGGESPEDEIESLSLCLLLGNLKSLLDSFDSATAFVTKAKATQWHARALRATAESSRQCTCARGAADFGCALLPLLRLTVAAELYVSRVSLKHVMNIPLLLECADLLDAMSRAAQSLQLAGLWTAHAQLARHLDLVNRFLAFQIQCYSRLFKQAPRDWPGWPLAKNLKVLSKIASKFRALPPAQLQKLSRAKGKPLGFPERARMDVAGLVALVEQSRADGPGSARRAT